MANNYTQLTDKLELIFWPYLRLTVLFVVGFGLLDAALLHWLPSFDPPYVFWKFLGPAVLAAVLTVWALWSRLCLLAESKGRGNLAVGMTVIVVLTMAFSTGCLHDYLRISLGRLEVVGSPAALAGGRSRGTYYRFQHKYQSARYAGVEPQSTTGNKGRTVVFNVYVATPLLTSPADAGQPAASWQGLHYSAQVEARASDADKWAAYQAFRRRADSLLAQEQFSAPAGYYERIPNTDERAAYLRAARRTGLCPPDAAFPILLLQPGQASLADLKRSALYQLVGGLAGGTALFFLTCLPPARRRFGPGTLSFCQQRRARTSSAPYFETCISASRTLHSHAPGAANARKEPFAAPGAHLLYAEALGLRAAAQQVHPGGQPGRQG